MWQNILGCMRDRPYVCWAWLDDAQPKTAVFFGVLLGGVFLIVPVDGT
jgi:hypothetical protein